MGAGDEGRQGVVRTTRRKGRGRDNWARNLREKVVVERRKKMLEDLVGASELLLRVVLRVARRPPALRLRLRVVARRLLVHPPETAAHFALQHGVVLLPLHRIAQRRVRVANLLEHFRRL